MGEGRDPGARDRVASLLDRAVPKPLNPGKSANRTSILHWRKRGCAKRNTRFWADGRLTLPWDYFRVARSAIALTLWKKEERFDAEQLKPQAA